MYTEDNTRYSYLNDRHLALIQVWNTEEKRQMPFTPLTRSSVHIWSSSSWWIRSFFTSQRLISLVRRSATCLVYRLTRYLFHSVTQRFFSRFFLRVLFLMKSEWLKEKEEKRKISYRVLSLIGETCFLYQTIMSKIKDDCDLADALFSCAFSASGLLLLWVQIGSWRCQRRIIVLGQILLLWFLFCYSH